MLPASWPTLLREHLASRAGLDIDDVAVRDIAEPAMDTAFEIVTGGSSLDELRNAVPDAEFVGWANPAGGRRPLGITRRAPAMSPAPDDFRVLAIVPIYDEVDILERTITHLVAQGVEIHVLDNWSTDGSREVAQRWLGRGVIAIEPYPEAGPSELFDLKDLLTRIPEVGRTSAADWIIYHDADEIRSSPWPGVTLRDAVWHVDQCGFTCINLTLMEFIITDPEVAAGGLGPEMALEQVFPCFRATPVGDLTQLKFWKNTGQVVEIASSGGHNARFEGRRVFPYNFLLRHYSHRSADQVRRKIEARERRRPASERRLGWGRHYAEIDTNFPWPEQGELRMGDHFDEDFLVERLTGIGWRVEIEPPTSFKHKVARVLQRIGIWRHYERLKRRLRR